MRSLTRRVSVFVVVASLLVTGGGMLLGTSAVDAPWIDGGQSPGVGLLALGCAVAAVAEFVRLRVRLDNGFVELSWGEAAIIVLAYVLPAGWVPAAVLVGVGGAHTALSLVDQRRTTSNIVRTAATLTVAAAAATVVTHAIVPDLRDGLSAPAVLGLVAGALVYSLVSVHLLAMQLATTGREAIGLFGRLMSGKPIMLLGNVTVGLIAVTVQIADRAWLVLLPPLVWLLQQTYAYRVRLDDERRTWQLFTDVAGELNRLDEYDTATAGIEGALRLFPAAVVEVVVGVVGQPRAYSGERDGAVVETTSPSASPESGATSSGASLGSGATSSGTTASGVTESGASTASAKAAGIDWAFESAKSSFSVSGRKVDRGATPWEPDETQDPLSALDWITLPRLRRNKSIETHPLIVGGVQIGELRLHMQPSARLTRRDRLVLAAYGDALAAALHDAATHHELRSIVDRSSYEAVHDALTGMVNRGALLTRGNAALRAIPARSAVALLLLDVNHFKEVNNALGHAAGDELLQVIARRLASATGPSEILARLGGDEFALLLTDLPAPDPAPDARRAPSAGHVSDAGGTSDAGPAVEAEQAQDPGQRSLLDHAVGKARWLAEQVAAPTEVCGVMLSVEASVGVVTARAGDIDMTELLRRADIAMYQAKRGNGGIAWYEPSWDESSIDKLALLAELREALAVRDQLTLVLQPIVELDTGRPVGAEALVRWQHPRRGWLEPKDFLDAIEHSELVGVFARYVLDAALEIVASWMTLGIDTPIAVNLSARSLLDRTLAQDLPRMLEQRGVPPSRLTLEITESVVLSELTVVEEVLAALRATGVRLAVDDFGSGFSSLTFLTSVPVDEVKIDRAFVARVVESPEAAAIVRTTVALGRELDLRVVAEGVESAAQRLALAGLGCTTAQGFYFFRPLPPARLAVVLAQSTGDRTMRNVRPLRKEGTG